MTSQCKQHARHLHSGHSVSSLIASSVAHLCVVVCILYVYLYVYLCCSDPFESNEILPEVAPLVPPQARPFQRLSSKLHPATAADVDMTEEDEQSPQYALVDENEDDMIEEGGQDDLFGNNDVEADDEEDEEEVVDLTSAMVLDALIDRIKLQRSAFINIFICTYAIVCFVE